MPIQQRNTVQKYRNTAFVIIASRAMHAVATFKSWHLVHSRGWRGVAHLNHRYEKKNAVDKCSWKITLTSTVWKCSGEIHLRSTFKWWIWKDKCGCCNSVHPIFHRNAMIWAVDPFSLKMQPFWHSIVSDSSMVILVDDDRIHYSNTWQIRLLELSRYEERVAKKLSTSLKFPFSYSIWIQVYSAKYLGY